ncbi:hypothetical protein ACIQU5_28090 [Streptomyces sp. NPDC090306]|uniref:hypothetical protein n=1 Tax=Streptomyces sp. NPDC090306 TaxID=3365961 RepID=UPI00380919B5
MTDRPPPAPPPDVPRPATVQLLALAEAARPDWPPHMLRDALAQARTHGMTWGQVLAEAGRLMADPGAQPGDLVAAAPEPWRRRRPTQDADTAHRGAAAARAALTTTPENT